MSVRSVGDNEDSLLAIEQELSGDPGARGGATSTRSSVLVVLGGGGHTTEILHLVDLLGPGYEYEYLVAVEDDQSAAKIRHTGSIYRVPRPRLRPGKRRHPLIDPWLSLRCFASAFPLMRRVRPSIVLTTGPWIGVITGIAARLLGIRVVFVETGSRLTTLSFTGKAMRFLADDFFVQSRELTSLVPNARYAGRLW